MPLNLMNWRNAMKTLVKAVAVLALSAASLSAVPLTNADRYGEAPIPAAAERTIVIGANTRFAHATHGAIVKFSANGQQLSCGLADLPQGSNLNQDVPQPLLQHPSRMHIA